MAKYHNKKRNIGIIYEQIISYTGKKMISNDKKEVELAINIIREHFKKGTQLYKEYKLFKALASTNNVSDNLATSIIEKAKSASNSMFDEDSLQREKSRLIKKLNYTFGKGNIFKENIENYRTYATIQTLLNEWRNEESDFELLTEFEIKLHNLLTEKKQIVSEDVLTENRKLTNLEFKVMNNLYKEKYENNLTDIQKIILESYLKNDEDLLKENFIKLKVSTINLLKEYTENTDNNLIKEKYHTIKSSIKLLEEQNFSKENIHKYLTLSKLYNELLGE
jgi:hypothetical protein